ncbi:DUF5327 family protein [Staphylococcus pseudintermedius]|uniref:DUF5327 family protein n=1 Tax=Staphylococcus pseudintermedius TaxID=283734 RepID=UPI0028FD85C9|nr:DUF5327 family protein [Staphylococcus pseudintermedius]MDU0383936.1 DUF5327 family protein [Staphylococcus pseudintermedius]
MNKDKLIQLLEHELVQADAATTDAAFEKHIYAIHALTALYTGQKTSAPSRSSSTVTPKRQVSTQVTDEEIRMMGGKVSSSSATAQTTSDQRMITDDEIGNGASIFDF